MNQVVMINNNSIDTIRSLFSLAVNKICLSGKGSDTALPPPHPTPSAYSFYIPL